MAERKERSIGSEWLVAALSAVAILAALTTAREVSSRSRVQRDRERYFLALELAAQPSLREDRVDDAAARSGERQLLLETARYLSDQNERRGLRLGKSTSTILLFVAYSVASFAVGGAAYSDYHENSSGATGALFWLVVTAALWGIMFGIAAIWALVNRARRTARARRITPQVPSFLHAVRIEGARLPAVAMARFRVRAGLKAIRAAERRTRGAKSADLGKAPHSSVDTHTG